MIHLFHGTNEGLGIKEAMRVVYDSRLYADLSNPDTGLYREGPVYLYDMLCEERGLSQKCG